MGSELSPSRNWRRSLNSTWAATDCGWLVVCPDFVVSCSVRSDDLLERGDGLGNAHFGRSFRLAPVEARLRSTGQHFDAEVLGHGRRAFATDSASKPPLVRSALPQGFTRKPPSWQGGRRSRRMWHLGQVPSWRNQNPISDTIPRPCGQSFDDAPNHARPMVPAMAGAEGKGLVGSSYTARRALHHEFSIATDLCPESSNRQAITN